MIDKFLAYAFIRKLTMPFRRWTAFKRGVIDKDGNVLVDRTDMTDAQKKAFSTYDQLILNLKKLVNKVPGSRRLNTYTAALFLIREGEELIGCSEQELNERFEFLFEEVPTTNISKGNIAHKDKPIIDGDKRKRYKRKNRKWQLLHRQSSER